MPEEEIDKAVRLEATQVCPFSVDESTVDFHVVNNGCGRSSQGAGEGVKHVSGLMVAAMNRCIRSQQELIERAGRDCVLVDVDGLALLNGLNACGEEAGEGPLGVLDIGATYTTVALRPPGAIPFVRDLPHGGAAIIARVAESCDLSRSTVENLLFNGNDFSAKFRDIAPVFNEACDSLVNSVGETIRYYENHEKEPIARLHVAGGFAGAKGLLRRMGKRLGREFVLWDPMETLERTPALGNAGLSEGGPAFAVATGLALRPM
jgi:type IV pilus assembly protein PilM